MSDPNTQDLITSAFEQLPRQEKVKVVQELAYLLSEDLGSLNDPVLQRETDVLCSICDNVEGRIQEIRAIYGVG